MSDKKAFVAAYKGSLHKFVPITPEDNTGSSPESDRTLLINVDGLSTLLKSNLLAFLCELVHNFSLHEFVESYLQCRNKRRDSQELPRLWELDKLVFLIMLRLVSAGELTQLEALLPRASLEVVGTNKSEGESAGLKRQQSLNDQFRLLAETVPFCRIPQAMDMVTIIGEANSAASGSLLEGVCTLRRNGHKELSEALRETIKAMEQVHLSVILLSRRVQEHRQPRSSTVKPSTTKVSGLSVVNHDRRVPASGKHSSKQTAAEELTFLCSFSADIVLTLSATLEAAARAPGLPLTATGLLCLQGTHLTGKQGLSLLRAVQNMYEVQLPLLARTAALEAANVDGADFREQLNLLQKKCLQLLHSQLQASKQAIEALNQGSSSGAGVFDTMDVLSEDGVDWASFLNGQDPLGRDPLVLIASAANAGESKSVKALSTGATVSTGSAQSRSTITSAGVTHTVEECEVVRGALVADYLKLYGPACVDAVVRHALGADADEDRVAYVLASLQGQESLLEEPKARVAAPPPAATVEPAMGRATSAPAPSQGNADTVDAIKGLFPDLGEGFIEACIAAYHGNLEEIVDALLTNNLQPKLLVLDRSLQKVWIGKGGGGAQERVSLDTKSRDARTYQAVEDAEFKRMQLERVRKMEAQQELDHMLLSREYNDDYDDQYDDQIADPLKVQPYGDRGDAAKAATAPAESRPKLAPVHTPAPAILNRRDRRKLKGQGEAGGPAQAVAVAPAPVPLSKATVHQQMAEMKRLNTLTKEAEVEAAYWEGMRNTNHHSSAHSGKGSWKAELQRLEQEALAAEQGGTLPAPPGRSAPGAASAAPPRPSGGGPHGGEGRATKGASDAKVGATSAEKGGNTNQKSAAAGGAGKGKSNGASSVEGADGASATGSDGAQRKHRTKPYDKHHQKDRSTRKFSHFAPTS